MDVGFKKILSCFDESIITAVTPVFNDLSEIRIRANRPVTAYIPQTPCFVARDGTLSENFGENLLTVTFGELREAFSRLCSYSVYKHMDNVCRGFITVFGGHRIGVCGTAVCSGDRISSVCDITGLNIRCAKEFPGCADVILRSVRNDGGLLICGAPSSGKTTILRDMARTLSVNERQKIVVIDERMEIASYFCGQAGFDVGLADVYSGYPKREAVTLAVRTMSPDIIICDELTGDDSESISAALNCGVKVTAAVHCRDLAEARRNISVNKLIKTGAFGNVIFLDGNIPAGISQICAAEELAV